MADDVRRDRAKALFDAMGLGYGGRFPLHVLFRMALFIHDESIVYAGARLIPDEDRHRAPVTGEAVAFTATRVVHATFAGAAVDDEPAREAAGTASCRVWARGSLVSCAVPEGDDWAWHHEWPSLVPPGAQIVLEYAGGTTLSLPLDPDDRRGAKLEALLAGLLANLDAR